MGKRGRRRANYNSDTSDISLSNIYNYSDNDEDGDGDDCYGGGGCPWSLVIQDNDDELYKLLVYYRKRDLRFEWVGLGTIRKLLDGVVKIAEDSSVNTNKCKIEGDDEIIEGFLSDVYDITNMSKNPIVYSNNEGCDKYGINENRYFVYSNYMTYNLLKHISNYFIKK